MTGENTVEAQNGKGVDVIVVGVESGTVQNVLREEDAVEAEKGEDVVEAEIIRGVEIGKKKQEFPRRQVEVVVGDAAADHVIVVAEVALVIVRGGEVGLEIAHGGLPVIAVTVGKKGTMLKSRLSRNSLILHMMPTLMAVRQTRWLDTLTTQINKMKMHFKKM
jgi:hypothetical protein